MVYDSSVFYIESVSMHKQLTALKINFQFNSVSHRVGFYFNGISFLLYIKVLEI